MLNNLYQRFMRMQGSQNPVSASDVSDDLVTTPSAGFRYAAGSGTLVSGTVAIATGLNSVLSFDTTLVQTGATATGATEVERLVVASITTGSVTVNGSYHSATAAVCVQSVSGTSSFYWVAVGT